MGAIKVNYRIQNSQKGMASIMVVGILVIILSLVTVGFARLMNRELSKSLNNQLSTAANYAAESAINDVKTLIADNPDLSADNCADLLAAGALLADKSKLSGPDGDSKYTCVLVDPSVSDLIYDPVPETTTQVVKIKPKAGQTIDKLLFSWESKNPANVNLNGPFPDFENETNWGNKAPVLRLTLYPVGAGDNLTDTASKERTYFFYPQSGAAGSLVSSVQYNSTPDGEVVSVNCNTNNVGTFTGSADFRCSVLVNNLSTSSGAYYYARIVPIYSAIKVKIKGDTIAPADSVTFVGTQSIVDVTAKATTSVKRLQARVNIQNKVNITNSQDILPENSLRSANTICKRIIVPSDGSQIYTDSSITSTMGCEVIAIPAPVVDLKVNGVDGPITINSGETATLSWTVTNATNCTASGGWSGAKSNTNGSEPTAPTSNTTYTLTCTGPGGSSNDSATINVNTPGGDGNCFDGIQNGDETGVDTGGRCGYPPPPGTGTCSDGIQNGDETGIDIGGRCGTPSSSPVVIKWFSVGDLVYYNSAANQYCANPGAKDVAGHDWYICSIGVEAWQPAYPTNPVNCTLYSDGVNVGQFGPRRGIEFDWRSSSIVDWPDRMYQLGWFGWDTTGGPNPVTYQEPHTIEWVCKSSVTPDEARAGIIRDPQYPPGSGGCIPGSPGCDPDPVCNVCGCPGYPPCSLPVNCWWTDFPNYMDTYIVYNGPCRSPEDPPYFETW